VVRVYIQWAKADPEDWVAVDVRNPATSRNLPKKPEPTGTETLDNSAGWLCGLNCQGIDFSGYDHTAIEFLSGDVLRITGWVDDPDDWPPGTRYAVEWTLSPPAPDLALGGRVSSFRLLRAWARTQPATWFPGVTVLPWATFVTPPSNVTIHGIWMPEDLFRAHQARRTPHGWREWVS
jgi:hypothetical protein